ncbi:MAG: helix-hairpin-helix domain-containing protein [Solirubrobacterales bacterium]
MKNKKKLIGSIVILVIFTGFLTIGYFISKPGKVPESTDIFKDSTEVLNSESGKISIYVNGEVKNPGVYKLDSGSRVLDAVNASGGFTENADNTRLNLAKKLKDEDQVFVNSKKQPGLQSQSSGSSSETLIDINSASKEELMKLPGIGEVTAQKIIEYRDKNGGFKTVEDLKKVGRIGDKTLEKFKDKIEAR